MIALQGTTTKPIYDSQPLLQEPKVNSDTIERYVTGLRYPATKKEIINQAERNWAPENVMAFYTYRLPDQLYRHPSDISFTVFTSSYFFGQD